MVHRISALGGYVLEAPEGDWISAVLESGQPYELEVLHLCRTLSGGDLFVDAGAHIGNHSIFMAKAGATVVAFEPNPSARAFLERNAEANGLSGRIRILGEGLWSGRSHGRLVVSPSGNSGQTRIQPGSGSTSLVALDDFGLSPAVLKVDVEGLELEVLKGASDTIQRCHPAIVVEANEGPSAVASFLKTFGYSRLGPSFASSPTFLFVASASHRARARPHVRRRYWNQRGKATWGLILRVPGVRRLRELLR